MRISDWSSDVCSSDLHDPDEEGGDHRIDALGRDRAVEVGEQRAAQAHQAGTEHEGLQATEGDILAEGGGRRLVVADGPHHAPPGRAELVLDQQVGDREAEQHEAEVRSEEHTSELQSLMRISYAVFCLKKKKKLKQT